MMTNRMASKRMRCSDRICRPPRLRFARIVARAGIYFCVASGRRVQTMVCFYFLSKGWFFVIQSSTSAQKWDAWASISFASVSVATLEKV